MSLAHWLDERQKVYEARQRRVETICHKNNVSTVSSNDTMEDLINFSVHNDSATGMKLLELEITVFHCTTQDVFIISTGVVLKRFQKLGLFLETKVT